ncbi:MAG: hypothetical protein JW706_07230 [Opitutales bacterium]|nr:hypothetical protein [Opitutales bacterium]
MKSQIHLFRAVTLPLVSIILTALSCSAERSADPEPDRSHAPYSGTVQFLSALRTESGTVHTGGTWASTKLGAIGVDSMVFLNTLGEFNGVDAPGSHTGTIVSDPFVLGDTLVLYAGGNLRDDRIMLSAIDTVSGESLRFVSLRKIDGIALKRWSIPSPWKGKTIVLKASDQNPSHSGWIGISPPLSKVPTTHRFQSFHRLMANGIHALIPSIVLILIGASGTLLTLRVFPGMREFGLLLFFAIPSSIGYAAFFIYIWSPLAGFFFSFSLAAAAGILILVQAKQIEKLPGELIRQYLPAFCIALLSAVLYSSLLHLNWNPHNSIVTAQERFFAHVLPLDNFLPYTTMERLFTGEGLKPFVMEWRSTDRPPLQAAILLLVRPFMRDSIEGYQGVSVFINCWAFIGVFYLLLRMGIQRNASLWILSLIVFSGTFFVNGAYVWPRVFPLVFLCIVIGMLIGERQQRKDFPYWLSIGIGCALSILVHQGSAIALAGVFGAYLIRHPRLLRSQIVAATIVLAIWILPWIVFQKTYDPPGNMLQKRFLANHPEFDDVPFKDALIHAYTNITFNDWLSGRLANIKVIIGDFRTDFCHFFLQIGRGSHLFRLGTFLSLGIATLPASIGFFAPLFRRRHGSSTDTRSWWFLAYMLIAGLALWTILLLPSGRTIIPHGSYLSPAILLVLAGAVASLHHRVLIITASFNFFSFALIWGLPRLISIQTKVGIEDTDVVDWGSMMIAVGAIVLILWLLVSCHPTDDSSVNAPTTPTPCP